MKTLLSRQLHQAWLETQMRKQRSNLDSPASTFDSHGPLSSSSLHSSSSSSINWDPGADSSYALTPSSLEPPPSQDLDGETAFPDPAVQYINDMLMEEDLEDKKCMMRECTSYLATVKGFYDILGNGEVPSLPCVEVREEAMDSGPHDLGVLPQRGHGIFGDEIQDDAYKAGHFSFSAVSDEHVRVSLDAPITTRNSVLMEGHLKVPSREGEGPYQGGHEEYDWIDDVLNSFSADSPPSHQEEPAGIVPLRTTLDPRFSSDLTGSNSFVVKGTIPDGQSEASQATMESTAKQNGASGLHPCEQGSFLLSDPADPSFLWGDFHASVGNAQRCSTGGSDSSLVDESTGFKLLKRSASDSLTSRVPLAISSSSNSSSSRSSSTSRFKRMASQVDQVAYESQSSGVMGAVIDEETLSFVQNKDLNAERYARVLNEGMGSITGKLCKSASASAVQGNVAGKGTLKVVTTADLKGLLTSCAQAVSSNNIRRAHEILQEIRQDASLYGSGLQRLAHYFVEGLVARLSGTGGHLYTVFTSNIPSAAKLLKAHSLFMDVCPFVKVSHYFANRAIMEAAKGASRLHVIDYGILYGLQWPSLISALAERKGGPPVLRITGIEFPQPGSLQAERVEMTGKRLAEYAKTYGVPFEYYAVASRWEAVQVSSLHMRKDEVVIVNSMHRLHHLLDETVLASNPRKTVLSRITEINPKLFVLGIKNGNYNAPFFMSRFKEALAFFSGLFDLLEITISSDNQERMMIEREVLGRDILNVVACEGPERVERPETYRQWHSRIGRAGLGAVPLDHVIVKEAQMVVRSKYNKNFSVDEDGSWMLLTWKGKVVHGLSLWKPKASGYG